MSTEAHGPPSVGLAGSNDRTIPLNKSRDMSMSEQFLPPQESQAGTFPITRPRRLRHNPHLRGLVRETSLEVSDLVLPLFVRPGRGVKKEIASMPGNYQLSVDRLVEEAGGAADLGVRAFMLFGIPTHKDAVGSSALDDEGIVQQALRALRKAYKDRVLLIA